MLTPNELKKRFTYHPPSQAQIDRLKNIRQHAAVLADVINDAPNSRELALAFTMLEQCVMWANADTVRNPRVSDER